MYSVTYYEEYPIYEPAEGGYYYAGSQNVWVREFKSWRKARQFFNKAAKQFVENFSYDNLYCMYGFPNSYAGVRSKYIGEDYGIVLTSKKPLEEHGWEPYC